jgi:hypothetical protein
MAPDLDVLRRAYLTPLQNPMAGVRIFWPFMLLYGVGDQLLTFISSAAWITGFWPHMLGPVLMLAAWPLFAAGAIRWHRWLVLDEPVTRLSLADRKRLWTYFGRTAALGAIAFVVLLFMSAVALVYLLSETAPLGHNGTPLNGLGLYVTIMLLLIDLLVALVLARFALGLPVLAIETDAPAALRDLRSPQPGIQATLLMATMPLTLLYTMVAYGLPKLTPDANGDPNFVMPTWAIALACFDALMLNLLFFYTALVLLSALSFWYVKHERARLLAAAPA